MRDLYYRRPGLLYLQPACHRRLSNSYIRDRRNHTRAHQNALAQPSGTTPIDWQESLHRPDDSGVCFATGGCRVSAARITVVGNSVDGVYRWGLREPCFVDVNS